MPVANILDPIHDTLDARVWDDPGADKPVLKPKHLHWIKKTIYDALEKAGYTDVEKWLHLVLTGSLTTYQYSDESDCDVSLFVDTKVFPEWSRAEMIGVMVGEVDGTTLPGTPHPMQNFVVPSHIKPHDLYKKGLRSGYDLDTQTWVEPPEHDRVHDVEAEENGFYAYALQMADKMERLLKYEPEKAAEFWHAIHNRRRRDMASGKGDFAESNIVYKFLANRGLFPAISEATGEYIAHKLGANSDPSISPELMQTHVLYNPFNPEKFHPPAPGHEKSMPWVYDPDTKTVHLGPPRAYHWELIERTPELRGQYEGAWTKPAMGQAGNIHGAMSWPGRNTDFMGEQVDPETKRSINQALGAPEEDEHEWNFA
jgi:hypothetical protein